MTDADLIMSVGFALWGISWRNQMAAALGVQERTVRYWLAERFAVPDGVWKELIDFVAVREERLSKARAALIERLARVG